MNHSVAVQTDEKHVIFFLKRSCRVDGPAVKRGRQGRAVTEESRNCVSNVGSGGKKMTVRTTQCPEARVSD